MFCFAIGILSPQNLLRGATTSQDALDAMAASWEECVTTATWASLQKSRADGEGAAGADDDDKGGCCVIL